MVTVVEAHRCQNRDADKEKREDYEKFFKEFTETQIFQLFIQNAVKKVKALYEYTPLQVKQAIVGYGRAEKKQVQMMVQRILNLEKIPKLDDTTDAMALAMCHAHSSRFSKPIE